ncbi:MAG TPA: hypothetical protein DCL41_05520 [Bdellovibrionales bacterium]|nr:hypothetical protein [Pseudobdellovibrionaceae bacterium]HAG91308.1 hypothetical protein [Bdellovibrionales bacterium]|tara:strand:- start:2664 stop:4244 length:1581 start_codon:yes stop_codon:yes gene_type:complete
MFLTRLLPFLIGFGFSMGLSATLWAQEDPSTSYDGKEISRRYGSIYDTFTAGKWLNLESLQKLIQETNSNSIEKLLESLRKKDPQLMEQYVLAFRSRSLQESRPMAPRTLLVANDGKFILAYNGHPKDSGYNSLEIMAYQENTEKFELREMTFDEVENPQLSAANPSKCLKCHQSPNRGDVDPRPNWEPYSIWPGFYGGMAGREASERLAKMDARFRSEDQVLVRDAKEESENLNKFLSEVKPKHPRYKSLGDFHFLNTTNLTEILAALNTHRIQRLMENTKVFKDYKWPLFSAIKCANIALPKDVAEAHIENTQEIRTRRIEVTKDLFEGRKEFADLELKYVSASYMTNDLTFSLIFEPLGVSTADWSMDFRTEGGRFAFSERFGTPFLARQSFYYEARKRWPEMEGYTCDQLEQKALETTYDLNQIQRKLTGEELRNKVLSRCLGCHSSSETSWSLAPQITFDQKDLLLKDLKDLKLTPKSFYKKVVHNTGAHATVKDQMPPGQSLSNSEREALLGHLKQLLDL